MLEFCLAGPDSADSGPPQQTIVSQALLVAGTGRDSCCVDVAVFLRFIWLVSSHRSIARWAAAAFGVGLLTAATPAWADDMGRLADGLLILVLGVALTAFNALLNLGILVAAVVLGRQGAPMAPWKRTVAVLGIVYSSLSTAWNCIVSFLVLSVLGENSELSLLVLAAAPLVISICATVWSAKLLGRNRQAQQPPPG